MFGPLWFLPTASDVIAKQAAQIERQRDLRNECFRNAAEIEAIAKDSEIGHRVDRLEEREKLVEEAYRDLRARMIDAGMNAQAERLRQRYVRFG